jgi:DNA-binding transcriptional LysR family regulator
MQIVHTPYRMFDRVRSFLAVMEEGSVNKAARRLGIAQPTLSRHIQSIEQETGGALFERGTKGMAPTDLGFFVRDRLKPLLVEYDMAKADIRAFAEGRHLQLRIGYIGLAAARFLNPALTELRKTHPDIKLLLFDQTPSEQLKALRNGHLDVALIGQEAAALGEDFYKRRAAKLGVCVVLPDSHPLSRKSSISMASLKGEKFIGVSEEAVPGRNQWMTNLCAKAGFKPRFIALTKDVSETFTLITSEGAVTLLPDYIDSQAPPGTAYVHITDKWAHWSFYVLRQRGKGSPAARQLVDLILKI